MAKKGLCYVGFAPIQYPAVLDMDEGSDPYAEENNTKWIVKDGVSFYRYGFTILNNGDYSYRDMSAPTSTQGLINVSPSVTFNGSTANNSSKDYGDDVVQETESDFTGGTLSIELNNDTNRLYAMLFDYTKAFLSDIDIAEIEFNANLPIPYIGVGAIGRSGNKYVAKWYPLVKFRIPNDDNQTRQETVTFGHITVEGDIFQTRYGIWKKRKEFDTLAAAKTWLNWQPKNICWGITEEEEQLINPV